MSQSPIKSDEGQNNSSSAGASRTRQPDDAEEEERMKKKARFGSNQSRSRPDARSGTTWSSASSQRSSLPTDVTAALERFGLNRYGHGVTKKEARDAFNAIMRFVHPDKTEGVTEGIATCLIADRDLIDQYLPESYV